ncbi:ferredoxin [Rhodococcus sp. JVH1]|uniref:ferredoxin n=1 Tax=Rhodococcus sp. JVH1 TaxID=745408 RepID=UPI000271FE10|nr:ferredoxin [Rhodococcus sp. JVH1]EJI98221.1 ferredoxin [Rhodococcus sp. JVH1]
MAYVVTQACVDCLDKSCMQECPVDCIYEGGRMAYINPQECIECAACLPVCPQRAIYNEHDLPDPLVAFRAANEQFFDDIGAPGGATDVDLTDRDVAFVASLPRGADRD